MEICALDQRHCSFTRRNFIFRLTAIGIAQRNLPSFDEGITPRSEVTVLHATQLGRIDAQLFSNKILPDAARLSEFSQLFTDLNPVLATHFCLHVGAI